MGLLLHSEPHNWKLTSWVQLFLLKKQSLCLIFFPVVVKCPDKSNFKKKDVTMTKDSKLQNITAGKSKQQMEGADCLIVSTAKKQNVCMLVLSVLFIYCIVSRIPHPGKGLTTVIMDLPISITVMGIISNRHYQRLTLA